MVYVLHSNWKLMYFEFVKENPVLSSYSTDIDAGLSGAYCTKTPLWMPDVGKDSHVNWEG